jgi:sortase A
MRLLKWLERLLLVAGVAALVWCAYILTTSYVVQRLAREQLASTPPTSTSTSPPIETSPSASSTAPSSVAVGTPLAELSIPRVGLSAVVFQGSDNHTLRQGLGHIETTPLPGEQGNVAIAGHRDSFFRTLQDVQVGDDIWVATVEDRVHYRVSWFQIVKPDEISVIGPTSAAVLTLVTCYPFGFIGRAPDRFVVRAIRVEDPAAE